MKLNFQDWAMDNGEVFARRAIIEPADMVYTVQRSGEWFAYIGATWIGRYDSAADAESACQQNLDTLRSALGCVGIAPDALKARAERAEADRAILAKHFFASEACKRGEWSGIRQGVHVGSERDAFTAVIASGALTRAAAPPPAVLGGAHDICTICTMGTHASGEGH